MQKLDNTKLIGIIKFIKVNPIKPETLFQARKGCNNNRDVALFSASSKFAPEGYCTLSCLVWKKRCSLVWPQLSSRTHLVIPLWLTKKRVLFKDCIQLSQNEVITVHLALIIWAVGLCFLQFSVSFRLYHDHPLTSRAHIAVVLFLMLISFRSNEVGTLPYKRLFHGPSHSCLTQY